MVVILPRCWGWASYRDAISTIIPWVSMKSATYLHDEQRSRTLGKVRSETDQESSADEHAFVDTWDGLDDHPEEDEGDADFDADTTTKEIREVG